MSKVDVSGASVLLAFLHAILVCGRSVGIGVKGAICRTEKCMNGLPADLDGRNSRGSQKDCLQICGS
jgi:hypothetical protein